MDASPARLAELNDLGLMRLLAPEQVALVTVYVSAAVPVKLAGSVKKKPAGRPS